MSYTITLLLLLLLLFLLVDITRSQILKPPIGNINHNQNLQHRFIPAQQTLRQLTTTGTTTNNNGAINNGTSTATACSMCDDDTTELMVDHVPIYDPTEAGLPPNLTCGELDVMAQYIINDPFHCNAFRYFFPQCCLSNVPMYVCEKNIRNKILKDYDYAVPPITSWREPLNVTIRLEYQTVVSIDVPSGISEIYFSILTYWNDPRLAWEIDTNHCTSEVNAFAGTQDQQITEVWVPDVDLYNQIEGIQSIPHTMVTISMDGTVVWMRNGGLKVFCQFTGVSQIPFDVLGCQLLMGPWVRNHPETIHYHLYNGTGVKYGQFNPTYNEYLPAPELVESGYGDPSFGTMLYFNFYFRRAEQYYIFNLVVPTIILTYVSMGTYLLDLRVGERLSYGMALALVVVAQQIATGGTIPISNERLWIDKFIGWSFYWVIVGLLESVFVGYLYFLREDHMQASKNDDKTEEQKKQRIYHGMGASSIGDGPQGKELEHLRRHQSNANTEVDVDEFDGMETISEYNTKQPPGVNFSLETSPDEEVKERRRSRRPTTLKQTLKYTLSLRTVNPEKEEENNKQQQEINKHWKWMYTISLRNLDRFFFFFTLISYTLFLIAMFISIPYWGKSVGETWLGGTDFDPRRDEVDR